MQSRGLSAAYKKLGQPLSWLISKKFHSVAHSTDQGTGQDNFSRRAFIAGGGATALAALYAATHGRHEIDVVPRSIAIRNLPDAFVGLRIAQVSDIHLVEYTEPWFLQRVVERVNSLNSDLVFLTGDFISRGPCSLDVSLRAMPVCAELLGGLRCPERYAILGNHDTFVGSTFVIDQLKANGISTLFNSHIALDRGGDRLWLCGVDDPGTSAPDLGEAVPNAPSAPVILMAHEPDYVDRVLRHPQAPLIDLMLAGHTHGGQIRLPWAGPLVLPPMGVKYIDGLFHFGGLQLFVSRGVGTTGLPFRINCPPEINHITLIRA